MKKELSIYLDLVRFMAAMVVFLGHASGQLTGAFLWQLNGYLSASVMVFFVLSGFVIAFVFDTKEKTITEYSIARISRLTSVVVPALILTVLCDYIGTSVKPALYFEGPWPAPNNSLINYFLSALLVQNIWGLDLNPGINTPFWSLSFELMFYVLFATLVYFQGKIRVVLFVLFCLFSGPDILAYFPIWLIGVAIYYLFKYQERWLMKFTKSSLIISLLAVVCFFIFVPTIAKALSYKPDFMIAERNLLADYIFAIMFSAHLVFALPLLKYLSPILCKFQKTIVYLASLTFSLYLFHRPLIQVFATVFDEPSSFENRILVIGGTFLVVLILGRYCENLKYPIKKVLQAKVARL